MTFEGDGVMSSVEAAQRAGITYRQLDHWERRGWIRASHTDEVSPRRRVRRYSPLDVARLAALRHLTACRFDLAEHGPTIGNLELTPGMLVVVGGDPETVQLVERDDVADVVGAVGRWSVFDPTNLLAPASEQSSRVDQAAPLALHHQQSRRSA